jgi:hypothetical protein
LKSRNAERPFGFIRSSVLPVASIVCCSKEAASSCRAIHPRSSSSRNERRTTVWRCANSRLSASMSRPAREEAGATT